MEESHLECAIKNHPALDSVMHLLPENVLVSGDENIPGLVASPAGKCQQDCLDLKKKKKKKKDTFTHLK